MEQLLRRISSSTKFASGLSVVFSILSFVAFASFVCSKLKSSAWRDLAQGPPDAIMVLIGAAVIFYTFLRSIASDLLSLFFWTHNITAGTDVHNTKFGLACLLDKETKTFYLIGQNNGTIFRDMGPEKELLNAIRQNSELRLFIVFTFPEIIYSMDDTVKGQERVNYREILRRVTKFYYHDVPELARERVTIHFHAAATSLSMMIRDPDDAKRARMIFTAKWAINNTAMRRVFCVVDKSENPEIFGSLMNNVASMTGAGTQILSDILKQEGVARTPHEF